MTLLLVVIVMIAATALTGSDAPDRAASNSAARRDVGSTDTASASTTSPVDASSTSPAETTPPTTILSAPSPPAPVVAPAPPVTPPPAVSHAELRPGSAGSDVTALQQRLTVLGYSTGNADGEYGAVTMGAVIAFQRARGLGDDAVVGPQTWAALNAAG
jgi:peptidoglycan hydrolase-like protein with peptidoglycan-binding domain